MNRGFVYVERELDIRRLDEDQLTDGYPHPQIYSMDQRFRDALVRLSVEMFIDLHWSHPEIPRSFPTNKYLLAKEGPRDWKMKYTLFHVDPEKIPGIPEAFMGVTWVEVESDMLEALVHALHLAEKELDHVF